MNIIFSQIFNGFSSVSIETCVLFLCLDIPFNSSRIFTFSVYHSFFIFFIVCFFEWRSIAEYTSQPFAIIFIHIWIFPAVKRKSCRPFFGNYSRTKVFSLKFFTIQIHKISFHMTCKTFYSAGNSKMEVFQYADSESSNFELLFLLLRQKSFLVSFDEFRLILRRWEFDEEIKLVHVFFHLSCLTLFLIATISSQFSTWKHFKNLESNFSATFDNINWFEIFKGFHFASNWLLEMINVNWKSSLTSKEFLGSSIA